MSSDGIRVNCVCPEFVDTKLVSDGMQFLTPDMKSFIRDIGLVR